MKNLILGKDAAQDWDAEVARLVSEIFFPAKLAASGHGSPTPQYQNPTLSIV